MLSVVNEFINCVRVCQGSALWSVINKRMIKDLTGGPILDIGIYEELEYADG